MSISHSDELQQPFANTTNNSMSNPTTTTTTATTATTATPAANSSRDDDMKAKAAAVAVTTYWSLLRTNYPFRLFFLSYVTNHLGEWFTYLASISAIEMILKADNDHSSKSKTAVSILIAVRLIPNVLFLPFGGVLADGRDRRKTMISLDLLGAVVALVFAVAVRIQNLPLLYVATFLQECVSSLYEPSRSSIVQLLTQDSPEELQKATYLTGMAWSVVSAFGSAAGGFFVSTLGVEYCYLIDSATYILSAFFMTCMGGKWDVSTTTTTTTHSETTSSGVDSPLRVIQGMLLDGVTYLFRTYFGLLVLIKPSMGFDWGASDIIAVSFSELGSTEGRALRLGLLFASSGIGCIIGPLLTDRYANMEHPTTIQGLCLLGMAVTSTGYFLMALSSDYYSLAAICFFFAFQAMGSSIVWVNSSLLLQKLTTPSMLGRVTSIELATTLFIQILSALGAGALEDDAGWTPKQLAFSVAGMGAVLLIPWTIYHLQGRGAGRFEQMQKLESMNHKNSSRDFDVLANELTPLTDTPATTSARPN